MCLTYVIFLLLFHASAEGQFLVIGSTQPIVAFLGDDIILSCHLEPPHNVEELTVEWARADPEHSDRKEYVHLYRHGREIPDMKMASYLGRTFLSAEGLRTGNISLKLVNISLTDQGSYRCLITKLASPVKALVVHLIVEANVTKTWKTVTPLQPTDLQTPDPKEETDVKGACSRHISFILAAVACVILILICVYPVLKMRHQKRDVNHHSGKTPL